MNKAQKLYYKLPEHLSIEVNKTLRTGTSSIDIIKMLLYRYNLFVGVRSIQKRMRTLRANGELV